MPISRRRRAVVLLLSVALGVLVVTTLLPGLGGVQVRYLPSGNMERTLPLGSHVVVTRGEPRRGDVVVFRGEPVPGARPREFVQRVLAVGGDTVECCDPSTGRVVLDGRPLVEPYVFADDRRPFGPVRVPAGRLFVAGDHRSQSSDSRSLSDDPRERTVAVADLVGVVDGPYGRLGAHARVLGRRLLLGVAVALPVLVVVELLGRRSRTVRRDRAA